MDFLKRLTKGTTRFDLSELCILYWYSIVIYFYPLLPIFRLLCEKIARKTQQNYSDVFNFLRCKLSFVIRKLVLLCIRGTRSSVNTVDKSCESDFEFAYFVSKLS